MSGIFDEEINAKLIRMLEAQLKAELAGNQEFTCPLCQGKAKWTRAEINKHLWIKCNDCGFKLIT